MNLFAQTVPLNILVVEDNPGDFLLLKENIHLSKIPVQEIRLAESLGKAIEELQQGKPDIVFLDLYLPDSNGPDSFDRIKEYVNGSVVIVLSGLSDTRTALDAIAKGAQDYLNKGEFDEKLLERTISYAMERRRNLENIKHANNRYKLVSKATHDLIWDWDLTTDEIYRDETAVQHVYGVSSNVKIHRNSEWSQRLHPEDKERLLAMVHEIKTSVIKDFFEVEYRFLGENGNYKVIYDRGYVVRNSEGRPVRIIGAAQDITEKRRLEETLEKSRLLQQRAITEATIKGQENEREELGKELHDNINQILATSRLFLDHALSSPDIQEEMIKRSRESIIMAIQEIRKLSHALLPPELQEFGLISALEKLSDTIASTGKFQIHTNWNGFNEIAVKKDQKLTIYRIVQEQLNNVIKHAGASNVTISLAMRNAEKHIELSIADDGKGFDPAVQRNGVGLRNITSRAELFDGNVSIQSSPGKGCTIKVVFPVVDSPVQAAE